MNKWFVAQIVLKANSSALISAGNKLELEKIRVMLAIYLSVFLFLSDAFLVFSSCTNSQCGEPFHKR